MIEQELTEDYTCNSAEPCMFCNTKMDQIFSSVVCAVCEIEKCGDIWRTLDDSNLKVIWHRNQTNIYSTDEDGIWLPYPQILNGYVPIDQINKLKAFL